MFQSNNSKLYLPVILVLSVALYNVCAWENNAEGVADVISFFCGDSQSKNPFMCNDNPISKIMQPPVPAVLVRERDVLNENVFIKTHLNPDVSGKNTYKSVEFPGKVHVQYKGQKKIKINVDNTPWTIETAGMTFYQCTSFNGCHQSKLAQSTTGDSTPGVEIDFLPWAPCQCTFMELTSDIFLTGPLSGCSVSVGQSEDGKTWGVHCNWNVECWTGSDEGKLTPEADRTREAGELKKAVWTKEIFDLKKATVKQTTPVIWADYGGKRDTNNKPAGLGWVWGSRTGSSASNKEWRFHLLSIEGSEGFTSKEYSLQEGRQDNPTTVAKRTTPLTSARFSSFFNDRDGSNVEHSTEHVLSDVDKVLDRELDILLRGNNN
jgi:hypothetical protein